jgi:peptidoglycan/LPS O-acetylase OafA/YrhL
VLPIVFGPHERSPILKTLSNPVLSYLGLVSYGIYLWHQAFLTWAEDLFGWETFEGNFIVLVVVGSLGSIAAAAASHRLVEAPLTAFVKDRLAARREGATR